MGDPLIGYEDLGTGGFEDAGLMAVCEEIWPFPSATAWVDRGAIRMRVSEWVEEHLWRAADRGAVAGAKYPSLCFALDLLRELTPSARFIHIDRPVDESVRSLVDRSGRAVGRFYATAETCRVLQLALDSAKREGLETIRRHGGAVLDVEYSAMLSDPASQVRRIAEFLKIRPTESQLGLAMELIEPARKKY
jgi:hypothetical protein